MSTAISRKQFLRGDFSGRRAPRRPPWSVAEARFVAVCSGCGECIRACPQRIVVSGAGGLPRIDFTAGECTFCAACARSCATGALGAAQAEHPPWSLEATIGPDCLAGRGVSCRTCEEACGEGAIRFRLHVGGIARPQVDTGRCTGCGACYGPCPARALEIR